MAGYDALLWRALHRVLLLLAIGVLGLVLGLGGQPSRADSLPAVLLVALVALPVAAAVRRMSATARANLRLLPRHRPLMAATAAVSGLVCAVVLLWALRNAIAPGALSLLSLALLGIAAGAVLALLAALGRRMG